MIRTHDLDIKSAAHPGFAPFLFVAPPSSIAYFFAAVAENALPAAGSYLTLLKKYVPCSPCSILFRNATAASTAVFRVVGINQFGEQVTELVTLAASSYYYTLWAYKKVLSIQVVSRGSDATAANISVGVDVVIGATLKPRYALPWRPRNTNIRTLSDSNNGEIVAVLALNSAASVITTVDSQRAVFEHTVALTAGAIYQIITEYAQLGTRGA